MPLKEVEEVPNQALIKLPARPDSFTLGTKLTDLIELDNGAMARQECIRLNAMLEWGQRENSGFGNQLMEMQQMSWAVDKICMGSVMVTKTVEFCNGVKGLCVCVSGLRFQGGVL